MKNIKPLLFLFTAFLLVGCNVKNNSSSSSGGGSCTIPSTSSDDSSSTSSGDDPSEEGYKTNPLDESNINNQVYLNSLGDIYSVWKKYRGDGITIAVIDSGFDYNHPEFKYVDGTSKVSDKSASFSYNGSSVTTTVGKEYVGIADSDPHGTFCASVAAGSITGQGTVGIAPNAGLLLLKTDKKPHSIAEAFKYAADNGARVVTISIGSYYSYEGDLVNDGSDLSTCFDEAITYARNKGVVICSAAGNGGLDGQPTEYTFPGACANVIGCGGLAYNEDDKVWSGSSYNSSDEYMFCDIFAPSENMYNATNMSGVSTYEGGWQGTSFASPQVAGAAALYFQKYPTAGPAEFETALYASAKKFTSDVNIGHGRLDVGDLLNETASNSVTVKFSTESWWDNDSAVVYYYAWNSKTGANNASFPGTKMSASEVSLSLSNYDKVIFSRCSPTTGEYWGAQTINLSLYAFNLKSEYTLAGTSAWWKDANGPAVGSYK